MFPKRPFLKGDPWYNKSPLDWTSWPDRTFIKEVLPELVDTWNNEKLPLLETVWEQSFRDYFSNRQTQEKTKKYQSIYDSKLDEMIIKFIKYIKDNNYGEIDIKNKSINITYYDGSRPYI